MQDLAVCTRLRVLNLGETEIGGTFEGLSKACSALTELRLPGTGGARNTGDGVLGDITVLKVCKNLEVLDLSNTKAQGSIVKLTSCKRLTELNLQHTHVDGSIEALGKNRKLTTIRLRHTDVGGNTTGTCDQCKVFEVDECSAYTCQHLSSKPLQPVAAMAGKTDHWCCVPPCDNANQFTQHAKAMYAHIVRVDMLYALLYMCF